MFRIKRRVPKKCVSLLYTHRTPMPETETEPKNKTIKKHPANSIRITSKTYYTDKPNSKGFKIGDQRFIIASDDYPMSGLDEANYLIGELVRYAEFSGNHKNKQQIDDANEKTNIHNFFEADRKDWYIIPVKYAEKDEKKEEKEKEEGEEDKLEGLRVSKVVKVPKKPPKQVKFPPKPKTRKQKTNA